MLIALVLALLGTSSATTAVADATPAPQVYQTELRPQFEAFGYTGELRLTFNGAYINGTYRPDSGDGLRTVSGGRRGANIWLDIPTLGGIHVVGTMNADGSMRGSAASRGPSATIYIFTAKPAPSPSP